MTDVAKVKVDELRAKVGRGNEIMNHAKEEVL